MIGRVALVAVLAIALSAGGAHAATCSDDICPYGYKRNSATTVDADSIELCCVQGDGIAFPVCSANSAGGTTAIQVPAAEDSSWLVQDGNGYTRSVGKFTGMCFTVMVDNTDCGTGTCCTAKKPSHLQLKLTSAMVTAAKSAKCNLSYGTAVANPNSLKRITSWGAAGADGKFANLPLTWRKNAKTTTICVYSIYSASNSNDCDFEKICGLSGDTPAVPDESGSYASGCELRIVGRKNPTSAACCTPTFAVESFDSTVENRLADGASNGTIELHGV